MTWYLLLFLAGCGADYTTPAVPPAAAYTDPGLGTTGAAPSFALATIDGVYSLPDHSRPTDDPIQTRWEVPLRPGRRGSVQVGRLPFDVGNPRGYTPPGVEVWVDGARLRFAESGAGRWYAEKRELQVAMGTAPEVAEVRWDDLGKRLQRLAFADAKLEPERFVRTWLTLRGDTRQGLLLPAPATAEWELELPASAPRFRTTLAMERTSLPDDVSDGAAAIVEVIVDGATTEVARASVAGATDSFLPLEADLARWAGKKVTLRLRSEPGGNPHHDYLFWGAPTVSGAPSGDVRRVIVIGIDTTRPDHFGFNGYARPTSPELDAIAANAVLFDAAWTPAPRTRPSFRSATTGRYPLAAVGAKNIAEVFHEQGFATGAIVANVHLQPRFGFHKGFETFQYDNGARAEDQVDRALTFLNDQKDRDTYLFLHLLDPHVFYNAPGAWRDKFVTTETTLPEKENRWGVYRRMEKGTLKEDDKRFLEDRYDGEIAYTSYQLGRLFHELDQMGGKSLVVIHSDHGEEFWEHGGFEHNHTLFDDTTRALLLIRPGTGFAGGRRVDVPVTLADIAPTLYDFAEFPAEELPELDGMSLRPLIEGRDGAPVRPIGVGHLRYGHERWGVVHDRHKYILHTGSGREELYDLTADAGEHNDLSATTPLGPFRNALADAHGMPVCPGLRLEVSGRANGPSFVFELPEVPLAVEIVDPERVVEEPANDAWGETPTRVPAEIGSIVWEPGTPRFTWKPGTRPVDGRIFVLYDHPVDPAGVIVWHEATEALDFKAEPNGLSWASPGQSIRIGAGVVLSPPVDEAARMRLLDDLESGLASGADLAMLAALGYLGDDEGHGDDHRGPAPEPAPEAPPEPTPEVAPTPDSGAAPAAPGVLTPQVCRW